MPTYEQIAALEERLRLAMLRSDVAELDALLSPELLFTAHIGQRITKQDDLDAHRSGNIRFQSVETSEMKIITRESFAVVSLKVSMVGSFFGQSFSESLWFTRIWSPSETGQWQLIAGHSGLTQR